MPESSTNEAIIQPNPYAGGQPAPPISMPGQGSQTSSGGSSSNNSQSPGQNAITIDDEVSFSGPSTSLNGTPQQSGPSSGGNAQTTTSGTDFNSAVVGMKPGANGAGQNQSSGWRQNGSNWYYFEPGTNSQAKGWKKIDGFWYHFDEESGIMSIGWVKTKEKWYYLYPFTGADEGKMLTGWQYINDEWYYLETDGGTGEMNVGWKKEQGGENVIWYYLFPDGAMAHDGWVNINEKWYCFDSRGEMLFNIIIDYQGEKYYVNDKGAMITSADTTDGTITHKGVTYEVANDGALKEVFAEQSDLDKWMLSVEIVSKWYAAIIPTYQGQLPEEGSGSGTRKYYSCDILPSPYEAGDDCSSHVMSCMVHYGILKTTKKYWSDCFNKKRGDYDAALGAILMKAGFQWYDYSSNCIPQRGDIHVMHESGAHHVEVIEGFDEVTQETLRFSWGSVSKTQPYWRDEWGKYGWRTRITGYWRMDGTSGD